MRRLAVTVLCFIGLITGTARGQNSSIEPLHAAAGTVLTFYLQTRLNPTDGDALDVLPRGTLLRVKILDSVDSRVNHDGSRFHGSMESAVVSGDEVVVHSDAEVRGLLVLLRSQSHPEGFRYELLITDITDGGKSYTLTASLNPSFFDTGTPPAAGSKAGTKENSRAKEPAIVKLPGTPPSGDFPFCKFLK
jgi:hypothetical protein